jgi:multiple antibiotic resistance protein
MTQFWIAFASLFVVIDPFGAVPTFTALTRNRPADEIQRIARRATIVGAAVLWGFTLAGPSFLAALGVSPPAFQVAGSALLFLTALEMLRGKTPSCACGPSDVSAAREREDIAIVPVALPLLAGPGAMATVMSRVSSDSSPESVVAILAAVTATFLLAYPILRSATLLQRLVGPSVLTVVQRVLGLVLAALSIQTAVNALSQLFGA